MQEGGLPVRPGRRQYWRFDRQRHGWFASFGANLVDANGDIQVGSDKMRAFLEWAQKLVKILPADALSYDDATDNRVMIAGRSALIFDPPSPYAVAKRDRMPVSEDMWSFPCPAGPAGRFIAHGQAFSGIWTFSKNKTATKDLNVYLSQRRLFEERCRAVEGFDLAVLISMSDSTVWDEVRARRCRTNTTPIADTTFRRCRSRCGIGRPTRRACGG